MFPPAGWLNVGAENSEPLAAGFVAVLGCPKRLPPEGAGFGLNMFVAVPVVAGVLNSEGVVPVVGFANMFAVPVVPPIPPVAPVVPTPKPAPGWPKRLPPPPPVVGLLNRDAPVVPGLIISILMRQRFQSLK